MLLKNPYSDHILLCHTDDHQLAAYGIYYSGSANYGLAYGKIGRKLKRQSLEAQAKIGGETMSQLGRDTGRTACHQGIYG